MRYLFAALTAVLFVTADFESSHTRSIWTEPSFAVAMAQPPSPSVNRDSSDQSVTASIEPSGQSTASVEPAYDKQPVNAEPAAKPSADEDSASSNPICEAIKNAAEEQAIPIGFFARLLWQESRFRAREVSSAGARGIAQFMPQTAVEVGLKDPFDPFQAIPASARFLRKLYDQFGNLGLAAAAYNAGGGRIERWLSRRSTLPGETRAYVKIITGHKAEDWTDDDNTVALSVDLPEQAPCEGVGGLSKKDQATEMQVDLAPSVNAILRKAEADDTDGKRAAALEKLRLVAGKAQARMGVAAYRKKAKTVVLAARSRKLGKKSVIRFASDTGTVSRKSARAARQL